MAKVIYKIPSTDKIRRGQVDEVYHLAGEGHPDYIEGLQNRKFYKPGTTYMDAANGILYYVTKPTRGELSIWAPVKGINTFPDFALYNSYEEGILVPTVIGRDFTAGVITEEEPGKYTTPSFSTVTEGGAPMGGGLLAGTLVAIAPVSIHDLGNGNYLVVGGRASFNGVTLKGFVLLYNGPAPSQGLNTVSASFGVFPYYSFIQF